MVNMGPNMGVFENGVYLVANYPRIVSGLVHPSDFSGLSLLIPCKSLGL